MLTRPDLVTITGAYDVDPRRTRAFTREFGGKSFATLDSLLADDGVEAIANLTSHGAHAQVTTAAIDAGKHVHSEKPLAANREDGRRLLQLARKAGVRLSCSPFTFLGEGQQTAWKAVREGSIGKVLIAYGEMNWRRIESWHPDPEGFYQLGAGPLLDAGVYCLTVLTTVLGPVERVQGNAGILLPERSIEQGPNKGKAFRVTTPDQVTGFLVHESGARSRLTASFLGFSHQDGIEFHGETGTVYLSTTHDFNGTVEINRGEEWSPVPYVSPPFRGVEWGRALFDMASSLRTGSPQHCTGEHAYHVLDICLSVLDSAVDGRSVAVASSFTPPEPSH
jgi:predicted dehydrogenase